MYIIVSNGSIREVSLIRQEDDMCLVRFTDSVGGLRVRSNRLFDSEDAARKCLPEKNVTRKPVDMLGPWRYRH